MKIYIRLLIPQVGAIYSLPLPQLSGWGFQKVIFVFNLCWTIERMRNQVSVSFQIQKLLQDKGKGTWQLLHKRQGDYFGKKCDHF